MSSANDIGDATTAAFLSEVVIIMMIILYKTSRRWLSFSCLRIFIHPSNPSLLQSSIYLNRGIMISVYVHVVRIHPSILGFPREGWWSFILNGYSVCMNGIAKKWGEGRRRLTEETSRWTRKSNVIIIVVIQCIIISIWNSLLLVFIPLRLWLIPMFY